MSGDRLVIHLRATEVVSLKAKKLRTISQVAQFQKGHGTAMMCGTNLVLFLTLACLASSLSLSRPSNVKQPKKPDEVIKLENQEERDKHQK